MISDEKIKQRNKNVWLIVGFVMILVGTLVVQKNFFEDTIEHVEYKKNIRISELKNKLYRYERIIDIIGNQVDAPNMSHLGEPHIIEGAWYLDAQTGMWDSYAISIPSILEATGYFLKCPYNHEHFLCCIKLDYDYIKYEIATGLTSAEEEYGYGTFYTNTVIVWIRPEIDMKGIYHPSDYITISGCTIVGDDS